MARRPPSSTETKGWPNALMLPAVYEVLKICGKQKLVVNTGDLSPPEALAVIAAARDVGADRLIVTHAEFEVVNMSLDEMKKAAGMGATMELCAMGPLALLPWMRTWRQVKVQETAQAIKSVGPEHFVLATDLRQTGNPSHADGLQIFGVLSARVRNRSISEDFREGTESLSARSVRLWPAQQGWA